MASVATPLLETIEADEPAPAAQQHPTSAQLREPVVLTPGGGARALDRLASTPGDTEAGGPYWNLLCHRHPV
jgi:hypothetical protein